MTQLIERARARRVHRRALAAWAAGDHSRGLELSREAGDRMPANPRLAQTVPRVEVLLSSAQMAGELPDYALAVDRLQQAVQLLRDVRGSRMRERWLVEVLTRLGEAYRLAGDYDQACTVLLEAYTVAEFVGLALPKAAVLNAQGIVAKDSGHYTQAGNYYRAAQELMTDQLGPDDPRLAGVHHNLAGLLHVQGRYTEAEPPIRAALNLRACATPPDELGLAADTSVLGAVLAGQQRLDEAEDTLESARRMWETRSGPDHYEIAVVLHNLADVYWQRGDLAGAHTAYAHALRIKQAALGNRHPEIAALHNNIAALHDQQGHRIEALKHYDQAVAIFRATVGEDHPDTRVSDTNRQRLLTAMTSPKMP